MHVSLCSLFVFHCCKLTVLACVGFTSWLLSACKYFAAALPGSFPLRPLETSRVNGRVERYAGTSACFLCCQLKLHHLTVWCMSHWQKCSHAVDIVVMTSKMDSRWAVAFCTAVAPPSFLLTVPNVTAHPSTASVPTSYYLMWHNEGLSWVVDVSCTHSLPLIRVSNCMHVAGEQHRQIGTNSCQSPTN